MRPLAHGVSAAGFAGADGEVEAFALRVGIAVIGEGDAEALGEIGDRGGTVGEGKAGSGVGVAVAEDVELREGLRGLGLQECGEEEQGGNGESGHCLFVSGFILVGENGWSEDRQRQRRVAGFSAAAALPPSVEMTVLVRLEAFGRARFRGLWWWLRCRACRRRPCVVAVEGWPSW